MIIQKKNYLKWCLIMLLASGLDLLLGNTKGDTYVALASANAITIFSNVVVIVGICKFVNQYYTLQNLIIPRTGFSPYFTQVLLSSSFLGLIYLAAQYTIHLSIGYFLPGSPKNIFYLYLLLNTLCFLMEIIILNLMNFNIKPGLALGLALLMNFVFHYGFIAKYLSRLYNMDRSGLYAIIFTKY